MSKPKASPRIDWKALTHALGPAVRVPKQLKDLAKQTGVMRNQNLAQLRMALVGEGRWFDASGPFVALAFDAMKKSADPDLLLLIADVLGGDHLRAWLTSPEAAQDDREREAREAALVQRAKLLGWLSDKQAPVRAAASMVVAMLPELAEEARPQLVALASGDRVDVARSSALLALARLSDTLVELEPSAPVLVQGAKTIAALRQDASLSFQSQRDGLVAWLSWSGEDSPPLPWFRRPTRWFPPLPLPDETGRALVALARARGEAATRELIDLLLELGDGGLSTQAAKTLLALGDLEPPEGKPSPMVRRFDELEGAQREMARRLAESWILPGGGFGLPAAKETRRRWAGVAPPGPLEHPIDVGQEELPRWAAMKAGNMAVLEGLAPVDRWQAWVEYTARSYPPHTFNLAADAVEEEIGRVIDDPELMPRARQLAGELGERVERARDAGQPIAIEATTSALLLLPFVRKGEPLDASWTPLMAIRPEPHAREVLLALDPERRAAWLERFLETEPNAWAAVKNVIAVGELGFTVRLGELIEAKIAAISPGLLPPQLQELRSGLEKLRAGSR